MAYGNDSSGTDSSPESSSESEVCRVKTYKDFYPGATRVIVPVSHLLCHIYTCLIISTVQPGLPRRLLIDLCKNKYLKCGNYVSV